MKSKSILRCLILALTFLLIIAVAPATAQILKHGVAVSKGCELSKAGDSTHCEVDTVYNDDFGDIITITAATDTVHHTSGDQIINMSIEFVSGNTTCIVAGPLPCNLLPGPNPADPKQGGGLVTFHSVTTVAGNDPDPLPDTAHVVVTDNCNSGAPDCSSAPFEAIVNAVTPLFQPAIAVTKTCDPVSKVGDTVNYTITLSNNSSPDTPALTCTAVDSLLGNVFGPAVLPSGNTVVNRQRVVQAGDPDPLVNTVTLTCSPEGFPNLLEESDTCETNLFEPCVNIDKTCDPLSKAGDSVDYTITVNNCSSSDTPNLNCTIADPLLVINKNVALAPGAQNVTNKTRTVLPGDPDPLVNTASVTCTVQGFPSVSVNDTDSCSVNLFQPCITINKTCSPEEVKVGDPVSYAIIVNNCSSSDTPSLNCTITDPLFPVTKNVTLASGAQNVTNRTRNYQASDPDPLVNTASVTCTVQGFGNVLNDTDSCSVRTTPPPDVGAEEPYKAAVADDRHVPGFYISPKLFQFTHDFTWYYEGCKDILSPLDPRVNSKKCEIDEGIALCPSRCSEGFNSKTAENQPEVCCTSKTVADAVPDQNFVHCPDSVIETVNNEVEPVKTSLTSAGNSGWYEWVIAVPKKPVGEMNLEIECGVLKPNAWKFNEYEAIEKCAAETGEPIASGLCVRVAGGLLKPGALPTIEVIAHPGCQNTFTPFHLTSYKNPGNYIVTRSSGQIINNANMQVLDGSTKTRIALKACMEKTILIKWPVEGEINALGETEANLEAGDIIKVRMAIPTANTVDVYCSKYSVLIGGIGEPDTLLNDQDCDCISDANCQF